MAALVAGPLLGLFVFLGLLLTGSLFNHYLLPSMLDRQGAEPREVAPDLHISPPTRAGRVAWRLFLAFLVIDSAVWYAGLGNRFIGAWGILIAIVFSIGYAWFLYWRYRRIKAKKQKDRSHQR